MAKIVRYNGNLQAFASAAPGTERTIFGDVTQADDLTSQINADFLRGWGIVGPSDQPALEDFNGAMYTHGQLLAYLHQAGVPEYDAAQEYFSGSVTQQGGVIYTSLINSNIGNSPSSSPASWLSQNSGKLVGSTRLITVSGLVVPTAGVKFWVVRGIGGGGGGGGVVATTASQVAAAAGGASGSFFETVLTAAQIGAGLSVVIGAAGAAGAAGGTGGNGGATSIAALVSAPGGGGGVAGGAITNTVNAAVSGGLPGGLPTGATILNSDGVQGGHGLTLAGTTLSGYGGSTAFGSGGRQSGAAQPGSGYGSGGGGAQNNVSSAAKVGSLGAPGVLFIEEYA